MLIQFFFIETKVPRASDNIEVKDSDKEPPNKKTKKAAGNYIDSINVHFSSCKEIYFYCH